mmetsp:Transcript_3666/g.8026  ORF Transcript_3666/g.8026 Transcript_3666/m.8026 type:complete len:220 (-) Transcript_3666:16-675(-)
MDVIVQAIDLYCTVHLSSAPQEDLVAFKVGVPHWDVAEGAGGTSTVSPKFNAIYCQCDRKRHAHSTCCAIEAGIHVQLEGMHQVLHHHSLLASRERVSVLATHAGSANLGHLASISDSFELMSSAGDVPPGFSASIENFCCSIQKLVTTRKRRRVLAGGLATFCCQHRVITIAVVERPDWRWVQCGCGRQYACQQQRCDVVDGAAHALSNASAMDVPTV